MSFLLLGAAVVGGAALYKRRSDKAALAQKNNEEVQRLRSVRLEKVREEFKNNFPAGLEGILNSLVLSEGAEIATVAECKSLPPVKHKARFYDPSVVDTKYAHWIDRVWNKDVIAFPQIIVRVATPADIAHCLEFVSKSSVNLKISVAAGCHSANSFVDGAFTIDLAKMTETTYNEKTQEATAQGGATLSALDAVCRPNGRVVPVGTNGDTGVAGLTLSGGGGWLCRKFGLTIDNLVAIDIVLPDGTFYENIRDDSPAEQRDLLWACRGSGGHFGIVTKFYFSTHPMPNNDQFLLGQVVSLCPTAARKTAVVKAWWKKMQVVGNDTNCILVLPAAPVVPQIWLHTGPDAVKGKEALKLNKDLKLAAEAVEGGGLFNVENSWKVVDHKKVQTLVADQQAHGFLYQTMVACIELDDSVISCLVDAIGKGPGHSVFIIMPFGGRVAEADTPSCDRCSISTRSSKVWILVEARFDPEVDGPVEGKAKASNWCKQFVKDINEKCGPAMGKTSHAFSDAREENAGEGNNVLVDITKVEVAKKLMAIKERVDPKNLLSHNRKLSSNK